MNSEIQLQTIYHITIKMCDLEVAIMHLKSHTEPQGFIEDIDSTLVCTTNTEMVGALYMSDLHPYFRHVFLSI